jgi:hypothetical protein
MAPVELRAEASVKEVVGRLRIGLDPAIGLAGFPDFQQLAVNPGNPQYLQYPETLKFQPLAGSSAPTSQERKSTELAEEPLGVFQVGRLEPLGEPVNQP